MSGLLSPPGAAVCIFPVSREEKRREREERKGKERKGKERKGKERKGKERKGKEKCVGYGGVQDTVASSRVSCLVRGWSTCCPWYLARTSLARGCRGVAVLFLLDPIL